MGKNKYLLMAALAAGSAGTVSAAGLSSPKHKKPNVIFILMDDAGHGDFGCYGQTKTETPNIDALAEHGILFTDMYTACALSAPSRCALLTGQHTGHSQIRDNKEVTAPDGQNIWDYRAVDMDPSLEGQAGLAGGTRTLGSMMQKAGYTTAMVGKWGLGGPTSESVPWKMGFDYYYGCICQRVAHNHYPRYYWENDKKVIINPDAVVPGTALDKGADPLDEHSYDKYRADGVYGPDAMYDSVVKFIDENQDKPFFLMWTTPLPHSPLQAPEYWVDRYVKKFGDEDPYNGQFFVNSWPHNYFPCRYPHATYAAMISYFDHQVGELVKELKARGLYENTLIIFTSDNGPANNASSPTTWFDSAFPFRCGKGWGKSTVQEGGVRMPFIVSWPSVIKEGRVSTHMGSFVDIMPTLAELAKVKAPANDGISILPTVKGKEKKQVEHEYLYWEAPFGGGLVAVRIGNWKGIVRDVNKGNRTMELYDISVPGKTVENPENNVASQHPEIVSKMWNVIRASHTDPADPDFNIPILSNRSAQ